MKTIEVNTQETSFPPVAMIEAVSNLNTKSGVTFDGFFQNTQFLEELEDVNIPMDAKGNVTAGANLNNFIQHSKSPVGGKDNDLNLEDRNTLIQVEGHVLNREVDNITEQLNSNPLPQEKLPIVTATGLQPKSDSLDTNIQGTKSPIVEGIPRKQVLQTPLSDGIDQTRVNEIKRTGERSVELAEIKERTVEGSHRRVEEPQSKVINNSFAKVIKINSETGEGKTNILESKADSGNSEKNKFDPAKSNIELNPRASTDNTVENKKTKNPDNFSLLNKDFSLNNEFVNDSKHVKLPLFSVERLDAINQLSTSFVNLSGVSMTNMIQKISQFVFNSVSKQHLQTKLTIDGGRFGSMEIQYTNDSSDKQITIVVETEAARDAIQKLVPVINENLDQKGVEPSSIDVQVNCGQHSQTQEKEQRGYFAEDAQNALGDELVIEDGLNIAIKDYGYNTIEVLA